MDDFKNMSFELNINETLHKHRDRLLEEFNNISTLNNISSVFKLYTSVNIDKAFKLLKTDVGELKNNLAKY